MKAFFEKIVSWVKSHPAWAGGITGVIGLVIWYVFFYTADSDSTTSDDAEAKYSISSLPTSSDYSGSSSSDTTSLASLMDQQNTLFDTLSTNLTESLESMNEQYQGQLDSLATVLADINTAKADNTVMTTTEAEPASILRSWNASDVDNSLIVDVINNVKPATVKTNIESNLTTALNSAAVADAAAVKATNNANSIVDAITSGNNSSGNSSTAIANANTAAANVATAAAAAKAAVAAALGGKK